MSGGSTLERTAAAAQRAGSAALLGLPGALVVFLAFNAGGFFPEAVAAVALILVLTIAARLIAAERPLAGFSRPLAVAAGTLGLYALWILLSATWSDSTWRALTEFDRALIYLLALLLYGSVPRHPDRTRWIVRGLAAGILAVCVSSLITRLLPDLWPIAPGFDASRLSFPITYWNSLGLLAAVGVILCFHLSTARSEPRPIRTLAAGAVPILATTVYFTLSRGAILVCIVGLIAYVAAARPKTIGSSLIACLPTSAIAIVVAYHADTLVSANATSAAAAHQGKHVAVAVALCSGGAALVRFLLASVGPRIPLPRLSVSIRRAIVGFVAGIAVATAIGGAIAAHLPHFVSTEYHGFVSQAPAAPPRDMRGRLTSASSTGRVRVWSVALNDGFAPSRLTGSGAGTFQLVWDRHRPRKYAAPVEDAHSLYAESLGELGIVGLALIVATLAALMFGLVARLRGPNRTLYGALFAAALAWAIRAGIDWDWEMPVVTLWVFALGGAALATPVYRRRGAGRLSPKMRAAAVAGCLALGVLPLLILVSQVRLDNATEAYLGHDDCRSAISSARSSASLVSVRPEPYEIAGYCEAATGSASQAVRDMSAAVSRDPDNWTYRYGLAVVRAIDGRDPRPAVTQAERLNRWEPLVHDLASRLRTSDRRRWREQGQQLVRRPVL
jgi:hypothetical protein